jgi:hypothetical protein
MYGSAKALSQLLLLSPDNCLSIPPVKEILLPVACSDWFSIKSDCVIESERFAAVIVQVGAKIEKAKRK